MDDPANPTFVFDPADRAKLAALLPLAAESPGPLTDWERGFVLDLERYSFVSQRQLDILDRLHRQHVIGEA